MKILLILFLGALVIGPLYVLYTLGIKYRDQKRRELAQKLSKEKTIKGGHDMKYASDTKIRFTKKDVR